MRRYTSSHEDLFVGILHTSEVFTSDQKVERVVTVLALKTAQRFTAFKNNKNGQYRKV